MVETTRVPLKGKIRKVGGSHIITIPSAYIKTNIIIPGKTYEGVLFA